jgi:hypothetical protein
MRIGQLARSLSIPTSDILGFLAARNAGTEADANTRLTDELVSAVIGHFAPEKLLARAEKLSVPAENVPAPVEVAVDKPVEETPVPEVTETPQESEVSAGPVEVIRVSKVELQGLKVLGKIELPDPKKKIETPPVEGEEPKSEQTEEQQPAIQRPPRKEFQKRNDRRESREWKNPLEQKREREAQEAERKKHEKAENRKEKRTNHYYSKVKSVPTKAARRIEEQTVVEELDMKEPPKTIVGKFLRWLRT